MNIGPSGSAAGSSLSPETFLSDDGTEILVGKLISTLLGGLWLTVSAGWITVTQAIVRIHIRLLDAASGAVVAIVQAAGAGGAETLRVAWGEAFRAAAAANPLLAPAILSLELVVVSALLLYARRRWM
jgi:hypothetical protein